jgi:DNA-binding transcriptional ArsR family regulator
VDPDLLAGLRALVDTNRLRIVARVGGRPASVEDLAMELRQSVPTMARQVDVLLAAGLVERTGDSHDNLRARWDRVGELAGSLATLSEDASGRAAGVDGASPHEGDSLAETLERMGASPDDAKVLRGFLVDGRLESIPAQHRKRQVVLRFLLERVFVEDREYPEKEVNQRLALFHPDVASLRRYLVDDGYVTRDGGLYRRAQVESEPPPAA